MKNLGKTLFFIIITQVILMLIIDVPFISLMTNVEKTAVVAIALASFTISLLVSLIIFKEKAKTLNYKYLGAMLAFVYFIGGVIGFLFHGIFNPVKILGYPIIAFLITVICAKFIFKNFKIK